MKRRSPTSSTSDSYHSGTGTSRLLRNGVFGLASFCPSKFTVRGGKGSPEAHPPQSTRPPGPRHRCGPGKTKEGPGVRCRGARTQVPGTSRKVLPIVPAVSHGKTNGSPMIIVDSPGKCLGDPRETHAQRPRRCSILDGRQARRPQTTKHGSKGFWPCNAELGRQQ